MFKYTRVVLRNFSFSADAAPSKSQRPPNKTPKPDMRSPLLLLARAILETLKASSLLLLFLATPQKCNILPVAEDTMHFRKCPEAPELGLT